MKTCRQLANRKRLKRSQYKHRGEEYDILRWVVQFKRRFQRTGVR